LRGSLRGLLTLIIKLHLLPSGGGFSSCLFCGYTLCLCNALGFRLLRRLDTSLFSCLRLCLRFSLRSGSRYTLGFSLSSGLCLSLRRSLCLCCSLSSRLLC
jgi:hypothetical protein